MLRNRGILRVVVLIGIFFLVFQLTNCVSARWGSESLNDNTFADFYASQQSEPVYTTHKLTGIPSPRITSNPISINGDQDFITQAQNNGWPGSGSADDPYLIENLDISQPYSYGISIRNTRVFFYINRCTLTGNDRGIVLLDLKNAILGNNTFQNNGHGILMGYVENVNITLNSFNNNDEGLGLLSPDELGLNTNFIRLNSFTENGISIYDNGFPNHYNCSINYYSDYEGTDVDYDCIGDSPYPIYGLADNYDPYPAMYEPKPPTWVTPPVDKTLELLNPLSYDLDASTRPPLNGNTWELNNTAFFSIDVNGLITNTTFLPVNNFGLRVKVSNVYEIPLVGRFTVGVRDTIPPTWNSLDNFTMSFGLPVAIQLDALDISGIMYWEVNDLFRFSISNTGFLTSNYILSVGQYELVVNASDPYENTVSKTIQVIITELRLFIFILAANLAFFIPTIILAAVLILKTRPSQQG